MTTLGFLRIYLAGIAARVWRVLRNGDCPCEPCRGHREFLRQTEAMYRAAVLRDPHPRPLVERPTGYLPTLGEARERRHQ